MGLFHNRQSEPLSPYTKLASRYQSARVDLLIAVAFTVLNAILLASGGDSYFLFSIFVPYYIVLMGLLLCGKLPAEIYGGEYETLEFFGNGLLIAAIAIAVLMLALYVLCFVMSSKWRGGWLIAALVLMIVDTLIMLWLGGFDVDTVTDLIFHLWVVVYLALGVHACHQLKTLPPEPTEVEKTDVSDDFDMPN